MLEFLVILLEICVGMIDTSDTDGYDAYHV